MLQVERQDPVIKKLCAYVAIHNQVTRAGCPFDCNPVCQFAMTPLWCCHIGREYLPLPVAMGFRLERFWFPTQFKSSNQRISGAAQVCSDPALFC